MKYIKVGWPEIQDYMDKKDYNENVYYDPRRDCWFIPEIWGETDSEYIARLEREDEEKALEEYYGGDIGDLEDALG